MATLYVDPSKTASGGAGTSGNPYRWSDLAANLSSGDTVNVINNAPIEPVKLSFSGINNVTMQRDPAGSGRASLTQYSRLSGGWSVVAGNTYQFQTIQPSTFHPSATDFTDLTSYDSMGSGNDLRYAQSFLTEEAGLGDVLSTADSWWHDPSGGGGNGTLYANFGGDDPNDFTWYMLTDQSGTSGPLITMLNCTGWTFKDLHFFRNIQGATQNLISIVNSSGSAGSFTFENCHLTDPSWNSGTDDGGYCFEIVSSVNIDTIDFDSDCILQGTGGISVTASGSGVISSFGESPGLIRNILPLDRDGSTTPYTRDNSVFNFAVNAIAATEGNISGTMTDTVINGMDGHLSYGFNMRGMTRPTDVYNPNDYDVIITNVDIFNAASTWTDFPAAFHRCQIHLPYADEINPGPPAAAPWDCGQNGIAMMYYCTVYVTPGPGNYCIHVGEPTASPVGGEWIGINTSIYADLTASDHVFEVDNSSGTTVGKVSLEACAISGAAAGDLHAIDGLGSATLSDSVTLENCMYDTIFTDATSLFNEDTGSDRYRGADVDFEDPSNNDFTALSSGSALTDESLTTFPSYYGAGIYGNDFGDNYGAAQDGTSVIVVPSGAEDNLVFIDQGFGFYNY